MASHVGACQPSQLEATTDKIVQELKSRGSFDTFRRECLADVDTRPAYQNLRQRVEGSVTSFLTQQCWMPTTNRNQLRERLRRYLTDSRFLETGVDRIVDQVVDRNIYTSYLPSINALVKEILNISADNEEPDCEAANVSSSLAVGVPDVEVPGLASAFGSWAHQFHVPLPPQPQHEQQQYRWPSVAAGESSMSISTESECEPLDVASVPLPAGRWLHHDDDGDEEDDVAATPDVRAQVSPLSDDGRRRWRGLVAASGDGSMDLRSMMSRAGHMDPDIELMIKLQLDGDRVPPPPQPSSSSNVGQDGAGVRRSVSRRSGRRSSECRRSSPAAPAREQRVVMATPSYDRPLLADIPLPSSPDNAPASWRRRRASSPRPPPSSTALQSPPARDRQEFLWRRRRRRRSSTPPRHRRTSAASPSPPRSVDVSPVPARWSGSLSPLSVLARQCSSPSPYNSPRRRRRRSHHHHHDNHHHDNHHHDNHHHDNHHHRHRRRRSYSRPRHVTEWHDAGSPSPPRPPPLPVYQHRDRHGSSPGSPQWRPRRNRLSSGGGGAYSRRHGSDSAESPARPQPLLSAFSAGEWRRWSARSPSACSEDIEQQDGAGSAVWHQHQHHRRRPPSPPPLPPQRRMSHSRHRRHRHRRRQSGGGSGNERRL